MHADQVSVGLFSLQYSVFDVTPFSEKAGLITENRNLSGFFYLFFFKWILGTNDIDISADRTSLLW